MRVTIGVVVLCAALRRRLCLAHARAAAGGRGGVEGVGGTYRGGIFTVTTSMLTSRHRDSLVAHELAHDLLDHDRSLAGTLSLDWQREQEQRELDANAKAVEILMRVRGFSEEQALRTIFDHLAWFHRLVVERRTVIPWGHRPPCEEIADLLRRFPNYRAWSQGLACDQVGKSGGGTDGASRANSLPG